MIPVVFHPQAETELVVAATWYEGEQTDLGKRFLSSLEDGISRIRINPKLFPRVDGDIRRCLLSAHSPLPFCSVKETAGSKSLPSCI